MKKIAIVSAPGKIHLIGEHSSVYGKPVLLAAINKRITVELSTSLKDNFFKTNNEAQNAVKAIRTFIQKNYKIPAHKHQIMVSTTLPIGSGLGSSAALSAAAAGAFFHFYGLPFDLDKIYEAAYVGERVFHGNPSGGDLAACVYGGIVWFRKETEDIKLYKRLPLSDLPFSSLLLIDSGKSLESTKYMVELVAKNYKKDISFVDKILQDQEKLTKKLANAFISKDIPGINMSMSSAQNNLESLGVIGKKARNMINTLDRAGFAAKVSGGGGLEQGSGMIVTGFPNSPKIKTVCKKEKWKYSSVKIDKIGVRIESK